MSFAEKKLLTVRELEKEEGLSTVQLKQNKTKQNKPKLSATKSKSEATTLEALAIKIRKQFFKH